MSEAAEGNFSGIHQDYETYIRGVRITQFETEHPQKHTFWVSNSPKGNPETIKISVSQIVKMYEEAVQKLDQSTSITTLRSEKILPGILKEMAKEDPSFTFASLWPGKRLSRGANQKEEFSDPQLQRDVGKEGHKILEMCGNKGIHSPESVEAHIFGGSIESDAKKYKPVSIACDCVKAILLENHNRGIVLHDKYALADPSKGVAEVPLSHGMVSGKIDAVGTSAGCPAFFDWKFRMGFERTGPAMGEFQLSGFIQLVGYHWLNSMIQNSGYKMPEYLVLIEVCVETRESHFPFKGVS